MSSCHSSNIQTELIELYTKLANQPDLDFGWDKGKKNAKKLGYSQKWLYNFPDLIWDSAAAVGNPFSIAKINSGMHILDIGCGTGTDSCIAAMLTGSTGKVVGVDCTPAMLDKAQQNAKAAQLDNIEFYLADMTNLPIANQSIDLVISNGAINLSTNKPRTFNELFRVLKPAGRLQFADMIRLSEPECNDQSNTSDWANCIEGTLKPDQLLEIMIEAGFIDAEFIGLTSYKTSDITCGALFRALRP